MPVFGAIIPQGNAPIRPERRSLRGRCGLGHFGRAFDMAAFARCRAALLLAGALVSVVPDGALGRNGGERPADDVLLAQAPGAGGASVPAVPASPGVPVPVQPPSAAPPASGGPRFEIRRFEVSGATLISRERIDAALAPFVGPGRDFGEVQRALEALERLFVDAGFGSVQVLLPEQELEQGSVRLQVIEPRLGKVAIEGNKLYSEANVRASLPSLREGSAPNSNEISANLRLANENPGKATTVLLRAGSGEGEVDAVIRLVEDKIVRWNLSLDNTGSGNTGAYRIGAGVQIANVLDRDHVFAAQVITSPDERNRFRGYSRDVAILGLQYRIPLYARGDSLDFTAGYSNTNSGVVQNIFNVSGRGTVFGVRYTQNLRAAGSLEHRLIYAQDLRFYENSVTPVGGGPQIVPDITVRPLSITYAGTVRAPARETSFYLSLNRNLPGGSFGGSRAFDFARGSLGTGQVPSARPGYVIWRYGVNHTMAFGGDWQFRAAVNGQFTRDMLVAGEQFGMGGATSVRGFAERQFANDYGMVGNFELYSPDFGRRLGAGDGVRVRAVVFHDTGHLVRNEPQPGDTARVSASGTGAGLRVSIGNSLSMRLDAAFANLPSNTGNTQLPVSLKQFRLHGTVVYLF
ncbi:MAG: ShlB/FhaC/HecB family hemolysin secretion/activation protein [Burkholderiales bacterium]|nr:ShlB/FhaC/HecB family hemolysin secretion/activation protein [Burkholderiales bacterium]